MERSQDTTAYRGEYRIELINAGSGRLIEALNVKNQLTEISRTVRTQMLTGNYTGDKNALAIKYIAVGTGTAAASASDTRLGSESFRKQATQITVPSAGVVRTIISLGSAEANITIREIGVFCGPSATSSANSGTLLSRANVNITKNSNIIINIIRTDTCTI